MENASMTTSFRASMNPETRMFSGFSLAREWQERMRNQVQVSLLAPLVLIGPHVHDPVHDSGVIVPVGLGQIRGIVVSGVDGGGADGQMVISIGGVHEHGIGVDISFPRKAAAYVGESDSSVGDDTRKRCSSQSPLSDFPTGWSWRSRGLTCRSR